MNRNLMKLFALMLLVAAALLGCGGSDSNNIVVPEADAEVPDNNQPDTQPGTDADAQADAGDEADSAETTKPDADAGVEAEASSDADAEPDEADAASEADGQVGEDADAGTDADAEADAQGDEPDAEVDADAEVPDAEAGIDADAGQDAVIDVPPPQEICGNGMDDDGNNLTDCADPACSTYLACQPEICNGSDDNGNGLVDETFQCVKGSSAACSLPNNKQGQVTCQSDCTLGACNVPTEICDDNFDNDGDAKVDCADPVCSSFPACQCVNAIPGDPCVNIGEYSCNKLWRCNCLKGWDDPNGTGFWCLQAEVCNDNLDNDGDGKIDCKDEDCLGNSVCPEICYDHVDNNGNGLTDCADPACNGDFWCTEVCDGIDNNGANGIDEGFECPLNSVDTNCVTACGSKGQRVCGAGCHWGACQAPSTESNCNDGKDDDCDGWTDCYDPECWGATSCPTHNFGNCSPQTPTMVQETCGGNTKEVLPAGFDRVYACCANAENDQWCLGGTYSELKLAHKTNAWAEVSLPVQGTTGVTQGNIACLGSDQVYITYGSLNGVLVRWDGGKLVRLGESVIGNSQLGVMMAFSPTDIRIVAYSMPNYTNARILKWNGSGVTALPLPVYASPMRLIVADLWGSSDSDMYLVGTLNHDNQGLVSEGIMLHFDGTSWARIMVPAYGFGSVHGTSSCDVTVAGSIFVGSTLQGITVNRSGNNWVTTYHPEVEVVSKILKTEPFKYILLGSSNSPDPFTTARRGSSNGDYTANWISPMQDFYDAYTLYRIPGTNEYKLGGSGLGGGWIVSSTCQ
ncbi:MAG: hypothetical protein PHC70_01855 [Patescibacteria group bacterium]|nr:hypothetical protein [Patescibacteria group bacterium]